MAAEPLPHLRTHSSPSLFGHLWRYGRSLLGAHYASGLILVGVMLTAVFLVTGNSLDGQRGNIGRVKLADDIAYLSESIRADILTLAQSDDPDTLRRTRSRMLDTANRLQDAHEVMISGDRVLPKKDLFFVTAPGRLSPELRTLYYGPSQLDRRFRQFITAVKTLPDGRLNLEDPKVRTVLERIEALRPDLERAAWLVENESSAVFDNAVTTFSILYILMMAGLVAVAQMVLKPLVTRLEETIAQLQQERDFTKTVLDTAQALIAVTDEDGTLRLINQYGQEESGWDQEEVVGENFFDRFIPEPEREGFRDQLRRYLSGELLESELETGFLIRSGDLLNMFWHNAQIQGETPLLLLTGIDITERKRAERKLRHTLEQVERLQRQQETEIRLAASLQQAMLPPPEIALPGIEGHAVLRTSSAVGGDYYDYYEVDGRYSVVLVGDVTGHGVGAGSLVSAVKAAVSQLRNRRTHRPAEILAAINDIVAEVGRQTLFMTLACLVLDAQNGRLRLACAGHAPPYCREPDGDWWTLESFAPPLGQEAGADYRDAELERELPLGSRLFLFTDGLVEAESPLGEMFGYERLEQILAQSGEDDAATLCRRVFEALVAHTHDDRFEDDVTVVALAHHERVVAAEAVSPKHLHHLPSTRYRRGEHPDPEIDRRWLILETDGPFADLLPDIARDDIRRVLPVEHPLYRERPREVFLAQHACGAGDDLGALLGPGHWRQNYPLTHTEDKGFILEEMEALLNDRGCGEEAAQQIIVVADEMLENAFYAAPRDGRHRPLYEKGGTRELQDENVLIEIAQQGNVWALSVTDDWGTLSAEHFLRHLARAAREGVTAGVGGAGLYMMWQLSHYLQLRVHPHRMTRVTALWNLEHWRPVSEDSGFQYFEQ